MVKRSRKQRMKMECSFVGRAGRKSAPTENYWPAEGAGSWWWAWRLVEDGAMRPTALYGDWLGLRREASLPCYGSQWRWPSCTDGQQSCQWQRNEPLQPRCSSFHWMMRR
eukprot:5814633-Karenia_brevis.AAC.1